MALYTVETKAVFFILLYVFADIKAPSHCKEAIKYLNDEVFF